MEWAPFAAFHIAYVAMGLTIWQGGWQRRFALILCLLSCFPRWVTQIKKRTLDYQ
jgi:hypothetical protein